MRATHEIAVANQMRRHNNREDVTDFERRYRQEFMDTYSFLNPDGEGNNKGGDAGEEEKGTGQHLRSGCLLMNVPGKMK